MNAGTVDAHRPSSRGTSFGMGRLALLLFALLVFSMAFQGSRGIWEPDEGRYTNIALRMLQTGDYVVPSFNENTVHFAKPPLTYWAVAGGMALLGWNEWGARLANALAFAATVLAVLALARRMMPGRAWLPPLIYATCIFPFGTSNIVTTDTLLTLWEALAVLGFVAWRGREGSRGSVPLMVMWGGFGLAFLTKGPPGLLPLLAIASFVALTEGWRRLPGLLSLPGTALFSAIGLSWYMLVVATHPGLMTYFIQDEFFNRIASAAHHRNPEWYKPFTIYLPVLVFGTLPWSFPLIRALGTLPGTVLSRPWWGRKLKADPWPVFLILWVVVPLLVFFLSRSRLPLYVLPLFVPLSLVIGRVTGVSLHRGALPYLLAAWIVTLPFLKLAGSYFSPFARDSRGMAREIAQTVRPLPREAVFVDSGAYWGLNLYLHCQVGEVSTGAWSGGKTRPKETLKEELSKRGHGVLLIARGRDVPKVMADCQRLGVDARVLGGHKSWSFLSPGAEFHRIPDKTACRRPCRTCRAW